MKYLLTESQAISNLEDYLNNRMVKDSNLICKIVVQPGEKDEYFEKILFEIYIVINSEELEKLELNPFGVKSGMVKKVEKLLSRLGFNENEFYVGSYAKENCQKK